MVRLRADRKAWPKLVEDLEREATSTPDPALAISALMREGDVWAEELGEPRRAIACFERVLSTDPGHIGALLALEPLYRKVGAWEELARAYESQAHVLLDPGARVAALRELTRLHEHRGAATRGDPRYGYAAILESIPDDPHALSALEAIALERRDRQLLMDVDRRLAESPDRAIRSAYLTRLGESLEASGHPDAIDAYRAALDADPECLGATRGLARLAELTGDPAVLAEAARREADVATDGEVAARLLVRSAKVRVERLGDEEGAQKDLERALELSPGQAEAADLLSNMLLSRGQAARLADLLGRAASSASAPERVAALWNRVAEIQAASLDNVPGAISSLNRVLRTAPNHVGTLRKLAELYGHDGQWTEAVNLLSRVVQLAPDREVLRDAHLALAAIWGERLGEASRALVSLQAVLALDATNREALRRLSELQEREGKIDAAAETAHRLVDASREPEERAEALLHLASIEGKRGDPGAEASALIEAIALEGPASESALTLKSLLQTASDWEAYAEAIGRYLARASGAKESTTSVYLELARVRQDHLRQPQRAVEVLVAGIDDPNADGSALRTELAVRLRMAGRHDQAIEQLRVLVQTDLVRPESWRDLARNFDAQGKRAEARLALMPLVVLGQASDAELAHLAANPPRPVAARAGTLPGDVVRALTPHGPGEDAAAELLDTLGPGLPKLFPADLDAYGLGSRDRVTSRQGHPLRALADRIASVLGVAEIDLFVHRVRSRGMALELGNPPALLVPASVGELPESQQVFLIARPIVATAIGLPAVEKLTPRELEVLLASACRSLVPGYGSGLTSEDYLNDQAKKIHRALPRRSRKALEAVATRYVEAPRVDFVRWTAGVTRANQAIAAMLSDDLGACIEVMRRTERDLAGLEGAVLVRASSAIRDLLRFWVSNPALELRRRIGMVESPPGRA